jgi:hypothetical protein
MLMDDTGEEISVVVQRVVNKGETVHICGIPVRVSHDVVVDTTRRNWDAIEDARKDDAEADKHPRGAEEAKREDFALGDRVVVIASSAQGQITAVADKGMFRVRHGLGWIPHWYCTSELSRINAEIRRGNFWFYNQRRVTE